MGACGTPEGEGRDICMGVFRAARWLPEGLMHGERQRNRCLVSYDRQLCGRPAGRGRNKIGFDAEADGDLRKRNPAQRLGACFVKLSLLGACVMAQMFVGKWRCQ